MSEIEFKHALNVKGNYVGGKFELPKDPTGTWKLRSPAMDKDIVGEFLYSYEDVDRAIDSATEALKKWHRTSIEERAKFINAYSEAVKKRENAFAEIISREVGKPLWEAKTEVKGMIAKGAATLGQGMEQVRDFEVAEAAPGASGRCVHRPLGVVVVLGPFNFPGHLPNGHILPALATGNTVIFKPSEKTPMTGQLMAECFDEAGFPDGVFSLVQGEKEVGRRLSVHEAVSGVLFTGSYEVGLRIKQDTLQQHWKLLALEMGGKNAAIVWKDADIEVALQDVLFGAYVTTGQRCSATSRVFIHRELFEKFLERFHKLAKGFTIDHPLKNPFMGPLIDSGSVDRFQKFLGIALREGLELVMRGKKMNLPYGGNYVSPSICAHRAGLGLSDVKKSIFLQTELFAPSVSIIPVDDLDEAIAMTNSTQYGLVASVFSQSREVFDKCWDEIQCGLINWNKPTVGASGKLPFGGLKKSGNFQPAGAMSTRYCVYQQASLEAPSPKADPSKLPGVKWEG